LFRGERELFAGESSRNSGARLAVEAPPFASSATAYMRIWRWEVSEVGWVWGTEERR